MDITSTEKTYIYRLNFDLLLHIFEMNADMFKDNGALRATRCASQVCRGWRSLLLRTSWIWARLLDLDWPYFRARPTPEWLAELLRRTGSAPLWIKAKYALSPTRESPPHISRFVLAVLTINWHRVERLVLYVQNPDWSVQSIKNFWGWVYTPAPQLREFDVLFGNLQWEHQPSVPLFAGNAPVLRKMVLDHHPIDLHASWLHTLRVLVIDVPLTPADAIIALQSTPKLECLTINPLSTPEVNYRSYAVTLPNLRSLTILTPLEQCIFLLTYIRPHPSCSLVYYREDIKTNSPGHQVFDAALRALSGFADRTLPIAAPTKLELYSAPQALHLDYNTGVDSQDFSLAIISSFDIFSSLPSDLTHKTFHAFACSGFASVTDLLLRFPKETELDDSLEEFLEPLKGVETLTTGEDEIKLLTQVQQLLAVREGGPEEIFPVLKAIVLSGREYAKYSSLDTSSESAVRTFVEARRDSGHVIEVRDGGNVFGRYKQ